MQKMRLRPGLCPGPHWGAHGAHPDLLVGWGGDTPPGPHPTRRVDRSGLPPVNIISGYASAHLKAFVTVSFQILIHNSSFCSARL